MLAWLVGAFSATSIHAGQLLSLSRATAQQADKLIARTGFRAARSETAVKRAGRSPGIRSLGHETAQSSIASSPLAGQHHHDKSRALRFAQPPSPAPEVPWLAQARRTVMAGPLRSGVSAGLSVMRERTLHHVPVNCFACRYLSRLEGDGVRFERECLSAGGSRKSCNTRT